MSKTTTSKASTATKVAKLEGVKWVNELSSMDIVNGMLYLTVATTNTETNKTTNSVEMYKPLTPEALDIAQSIVQNPKLNVLKSMTSLSDKLVKTWKDIGDNQAEYINNTKIFEYTGKIPA